jgi:hypothetical protein
MTNRKMTSIRQTPEWKTLFSELQRLQNSGKHENQDIISITGFMRTLEELEAHVKANR